MIEDLASIAWDSLISLQGETIEVLPSKGAVFSVQAVFNKYSIQVDYDGRTVRTNNPQISYRPDGKEIRSGDTVKVRDVLYRTHEKVPDGQGGFKFELHKLKG